MRKSFSHILLGFDFGTKYIGIAVGQSITKTSRALTTVKAKQGIPAWDTVDNLVKNWQPDAMIVGIPLNMDGTEQPLTELAKQFATSLRDRYQLPVHEMDERLTTVEAREQLFSHGGYRALQKDQIDSQAAQLILQNWLEQVDQNKE